MAPSRHDWKIVDWDVKPQHNQPTFPEQEAETEVVLNGMLVLIISQTGNFRKKKGFLCLKVLANLIFTCNSL